MSILSNSGDKRWAYHYGKKYCNIAVYELAGYREDKGLLKSEWESDYERSSHADIDPSFQEKPQEYNLVQIDLLGDRNQRIEEWIEHGDLPHVEPYFVLDELLNEKGPWVLLNGYVKQTDDESGRSRFTYIRGLMAQSNQTKAILKHLQQQHLGNRWLPEIPEDHFTYPGEIPWVDTYPPND